MFVFELFAIIHSNFAKSFDSLKTSFRQDSFRFTSTDSISHSSLQVRTIPRYSISAHHNSKLSLPLYDLQKYPLLAKPLDRSSHRSIPSHAHFLRIPASIPPPPESQKGAIDSSPSSSFAPTTKRWKKSPPRVPSSSADISFHEPRIWRVV